jgi:penicillin-binding protein 2
MSVIHTPREPELEGRVLVFPIVILLAFVVLFLRLWYLQVVKADELVEKAESFRISTVSKLAPRGLIVDRHGRTLAAVEPQIVVTARPGIVRQNPGVLDKLAEILEVPKEKLEDKVNDAAWRPFMPAPVHVGASVEVATKIAESAHDLPGIEVDTQPTRTYADSFTFAHILGYVWTPNDKDVARLKNRGIKPAEYVGKIGLEYMYEEDLMGRAGVERVELDVRRRPLRVVGRDHAIPGNKLVLSMDAELQAYVYGLLQEIGHPGAVAAIDPKTGEVLCLVSNPSYDTGLFQNGISATDYKRLQDDPALPMINRAIASSYSPGSTFKIVTTLSAVKKGIFDPRRPVNCPGYYQIGPRRLRCMGRHGSIAYHRAMARSCNTYFVEMALRVGETTLRETALELGLGERVGIDLLGEGKGIVPTEEWIQRWRKPPQWYRGDTANMGIGQGEVSATPLQMANVIAVVANNGVAYRPHLVRAQVRPGADKDVLRVNPEEMSRIEASGPVWSAIKSSLVSVITDGTAGRARLPGVTWGGKTGSTQHRRNAKPHSWFVGFAPADDPKIAIAVIVEAVGHGGDVAAPVAAKAVKHYLDSLQAPAASANAEASASAAAAPASSPRSR